LALIKQVNPGLSRDDITNILLRSTDNINNVNPGYIGQLGTGRLNIGAAISWAKEKLADYSGQILIAPYWGRYNFLSYRYDSHSTVISQRSENGAITGGYSLADKSRAGINLASGDVDGNGIGELIIGAGFNSAPYVTVLNKSNKVVVKFLAYSKSMTGGVSVATGDVNGDGRDEIITAPNLNGFSQIKIFNQKGQLLSDFLAYDKKFAGGVNLAAGDVNGDGRDEIVGVPASGGGPHVKIFNFKGQVLGQFMAMDKNYRSGLNIVVGNIYGRADKGRAEIIVAPLKDAEPRVKVFNQKGNLKLSFLAYDQKFKGGVSLASGDINADGFAEIITGAGPGGAPHVRTWDNKGNLINSFYAGSENQNQGINVAFIL